MYLFFLFFLVTAGLLLYFPVTTVLSVLWPKPRVRPASQLPSFACIITAYKNASIAEDGVRALLRQNYGEFKVILVADADPSFDCKIMDPKLLVLKPENALNSKVKSLRLAMQHVHEEYVVVVDADNLAEPGFLHELSQYCGQYAVVQGQRFTVRAKGAIAGLDAVNELYYNYTVRQAPYILGSSSTLSGSAMAVRADVFNGWLNSPAMNPSDDKVIVAEDKLLQIYLVEEGHRIAYAPKAMMADAKLEVGAQLERQRTRWLNAWIKTLPAGFKLLGQGLLKGSLNKFQFGILQVFPPIFLLGMQVVLMLALALAVDILLFFLVLICSVIFVLNFLLVLKISKAPASYYKILIYAPLFVMRQVKALLQFKKANKDFLATSHTRQSQTD